MVDAGVGTLGNTVMTDRRSAWAGRAAVVCALSLAACSGGGLTGGSNPFGGASEVEITFVSAANTWDLNKDNTVTCDEWKAYATQSFREGSAATAASTVP